MSDETEVQSADMDKLASVYLKIRDAKDDLTAKYKSEVAGLDEQLDVLEQQLLENCKNLNASSIRTPHGTIVRSVKSRFWTNDWDSMYNFIKENSAFGLLEKRLHQTNMKDFIQENPDLYPAGMNVEHEYTVVVRRAKGV
jgi:uncharacterized protein YuzB (UPF0349 family)